MNFSTLYQVIIKRLIAWLHGLTSEQWASAVDWVVAFNAVDDLSPQRKREQVIARLRQRWPALKDVAANALVELAVSFFKKTNSAI